MHILRLLARIETYINGNLTPRNVSSKKQLRRERARLKAINIGCYSEDAEKPKETQKEESKEEARPKAQGRLSSLKNFYEKNYKKLLIIPILILILSLGQILYQYSTTGEFITKGVSLKGGITVTVPNHYYDAVELDNYLSTQFPDNDIDVRVLSKSGENTGVIIDADVQGEQTTKFVEVVREKIDITKDDYSTDETGSSLGESFFSEIIKSMLLAFLFMSIVVFIYFRIPVPSAAVVLAAACDMIITVAVVNILGIKLSTAGIAAFLMLIGYSVDTDMLLSARVLKRKEGTSIEEAVYSAMGTGMLMTLTTIAAVVVGLIFSQSAVLKQIMSIILIGLLADILNTWLENAAILKWYLEKRK